MRETMKNRHNYDLHQSVWLQRLMHILLLCGIRNTNPFIRRIP